MAFIDKEIPATFTDDISKESNKGFVIVRTLDEKEKNRRILKYGGGCFLGAFFSIFLPILHFILVPGFIIAGVAMIIINSRPANIDSAKALCPHCKVNFVISKGKPQFPMDDICGSCHRKIIIETTAQSIDQSPNN
jgi:hypothetical protein